MPFGSAVDGGAPVDTYVNRPAVMTGGAPTYVLRSWVSPPPAMSRSRERYQPRRGSRQRLFLPARFRSRLQGDLAAVFALLADGILRPQIAARLPLTDIQQAVEPAESHTVVGKVVLVPQPQ